MKIVLSIISSIMVSCLTAYLLKEYSTIEQFFQGYFTACAGVAGYFLISKIKQ